MPCSPSSLALLSPLIALLLVAVASASASDSDDFTAPPYGFSPASQLLHVQYQMLQLCARFPEMELCQKVFGGAPESAGGMEKRKSHHMRFGRSTGGNSQPMEKRKSACMRFGKRAEQGEVRNPETEARRRAFCG